MNIPKSNPVGKSGIAFVQMCRKTWPLIPAAGYLLVFFVVVLIYLIGMSFSYTTPDGKQVFPAMEPVLSVLEMEEFREALVHTGLFVAVGTPLELLVGLALALLVYKSYAARGFVRSILIVPIAVPALVTATLLYILFDYPGGHINHLLMGKYSFFPSIIENPISWRSTRLFSLGISLLGKVWRDMPISMLILLSGLNAIDTELLDAARTMGAGLSHRLRHIIIPLILPSISAVVLLRSIEMWKEFIFPFVLAGKYELLGTLIESLYNNWGRSHEAAVVALILVACILFGAFVFTLLLEALRRVLVREWGPLS